MPHQPLVSVLIPSYNYARFMKAAIASVCGQTYRHLEILVLDDGSTDDSLAVIQAAAATDPRIRFWRQDNAGLIPTLNRLFEAARGQYIVQLDADDLLMATRIEMGCRELEADPHLSACFTSFLRIDGDDKLTGGINQFALGQMTGADLVSPLIVANFLCACTAMMRRTSLVAAGGFARSFSLVHDWDRWLRLSLVGPLKLGHDVGAMHRLHGANQSLNQEASNNQQIQISNELAEKVWRHYGLPAWNLGRVHAAMARRTITANNYERVIHHLAQKANTLPLDQDERVWLLQALMIRKEYDRGKALYTLLEPTVGAMSAANQEVMGRMGRALRLLQHHEARLADDAQPLAR